MKKVNPITIKITIATTAMLLLFMCLSPLKIYWQPYYYHYLVKKSYLPMQKGQDMIVGIEPYTYPIPFVPPFVKKILHTAFPDNKIIFSNDQQPHLIIRFQDMTTKESKLEQYKKWQAPYITASIERYSLARKHYRWHDVPLAEIVSAASQSKRQLYFPYAAWCNLEPIRVHAKPMQARKQFLAYTASNCVPIRENLFSLIKKINFNAQALGRCSNPTRTATASGSWDNLENIYSDYRFAFAMENHRVPGYVTEKIISVFRAGAIPIYWGDNEYVGSLFNPKAFIDVNNFKSLEEAAQYIVDLNNNLEKLQQMQNEPIFVANKIPEIFYINDLSRAPSKEIIDAAEYIRKAYEDTMEKNLN